MGIILNPKLTAVESPIMSVFWLPEKPTAICLGRGRPIVLAMKMPSQKTVMCTEIRITAVVKRSPIEIGEKETTSLLHSTEPPPTVAAAY